METNISMFKIREKKTRNKKIIISLVLNSYEDETAGCIQKMIVQTTVFIKLKM